MNEEKFQAPAHLSDRAKAIWSALVPMNARTVGRLTLLQSALESLDLADRARGEMAAAALTVKTLGSGTIHTHPLLKVEKEARQQFASQWASLGLVSYGEDRHNFEHWLKFQKEERQ